MIDHFQKAHRVLTLCKKHGFTLATVESCTGGLIAAQLCAVAGASHVVECGFITYSNKAKSRLVGVRPELLTCYGAVSKEVAIAMAEGGLNAGEVDVSLSVTGVAGPGGATESKPLGLVHFALARHGHTTVHNESHFALQCRNKIQSASIEQGLSLIIATLEKI
ncbi:CinA family protein [Bartonella sp. DGB2]|uniref:CinA family protein n=1 Tax=Bartonella sp. DGB2 TaxID=3388426 RepID=UPI003990305E